MSAHTLIFTPSGVQVSGETGESIYDVALRVGVDMQSICGGKGLCKRCQVELEPGEFAKFKLSVSDTDIPKASPTEKKAWHDGELRKGRRLACRAKLCGDLVVNIPADARERETSIQKQSTAFETEINPSIKLYMVKLAEPTLEANPSDTESLIAALAEQGIETRLSPAILPRLQPMLDAYERTLICVVRDEHEIIDIWPPSDKQVYGAAIDVGSTSVALYLYNLMTGQCVFEKAAMNPQIKYGEDLMSRVSYVMMNKGGEVKLTAAIREQVAELLTAAKEALSLEGDQILEVTMAGNPIMHHLFIGVDPTPLGQAPFTLTVKDWLSLSARDLGVGLVDHARVSWLPLIGGHVGADTTGAYLTQIDAMKDRSVLLVDIGTNAEIVLSYKGKVAAASSPTGPALEGAEISCGVRASLGAIERVRIDPITKVGRVKIIGHDEWLSETDDLSEHNISGICGSGIFEVMVELARAGLIDKGGLFKPDAAPDRFHQDGQVWVYTLLDRAENPISIRQTDIRAVQLAKAALYAGAQLLAESLGCETLDEVLLAGAFGTHLDSEYVSEIGIIPHTPTERAPAEKIRSIGNAAGMGAAMALLNVDEKQKIISAVKEIEKMETALEPKFQDYFVAAMAFPTAPEASGDTGKRRRRRRA